MLSSGGRFLPHSRRVPLKVCSAGLPGFRYVLAPSTRTYSTNLLEVLPPTTTLTDTALAWSKEIPSATLTVHPQHEGQTALQFNVPWKFESVKEAKRAEFKEQMGVFKLCYEKPFLEARKEAQMEKLTELLRKRAAQRTTLREKRKQGLLPKKKKTLYEQEQDRHRQHFLQSLQYPVQVPSVNVTGEEIRNYMDFVTQRSDEEIYKSLYPDFFGDERSKLEVEIPHKHHPYVFTTFFDPENPNDYPNQAEAEGFDWEVLGKSGEQELTDFVEELEDEQEREARYAAFEKDPARFKGRWTPKTWPKEDLELSKIKHRARNMKFLREQLKKHGLMPTAEAQDEEALQQPAENADANITPVEVQNDPLINLTSSLPNETKDGEIKDEISALLQELFASNQDSVESGPKTEAPRSQHDAGAGDEQARESKNEDEEEWGPGDQESFAGDEQEEAELQGEGLSREEELRLLKEKEARKHKLEEHEKQEIDYARKKSIFASEPKPGQPVIEFITNYTMDPDVVMGARARRDFVQRKVIMKVYVPALNLTKPATARLLALVGNRYDPSSGWLKLVGDRHENRHTNLKYVKLLFKELISESFRADPRYSPYSDLEIEQPLSLVRSPLSKEVAEILSDEDANGKAQRQKAAWQYKMFKFGLGGSFPNPKALEIQNKKFQKLLGLFLQGPASQDGLKEARE